MKDKSAFEESVFTKSNIIFEKRKKRRKTITVIASSSLCVMFIFTALLRSPVGLDSFAPKKEAAAENFSPTYSASGLFDKADSDYADITIIAPTENLHPAGNGDLKYAQEVTESIETPASTEIATEIEDVSNPTDKTPVLVEITVFGETVTAYTSEKAEENIRIALKKYFALEERSKDNIAEVSFKYSDGDSSFLVGQEFFDILDAIEN